MKKIYGFDYIRGISALFIMLYHYTTRYFDIFHNKTFESDHIGLWWGCFAVSVFFMLSGYLTAYTYDDKVKPFEFIKKRVLRLYPSYISAIAVTTLFTLIFNSDAFIGVLPTISNLAIYQSLFGIANVDGAYWTLSVEMTFYIIFAVLILFRLIKRIDIINLLWILFIIFQQVFSHSIPGIINSASKIIAITDYAHTFIIGVSLCRIIKKASYKSVILDFINLFACIAVQFRQFSAFRGIFLLIFVVLIAFFATKNIFIKFLKPLVFIANISYPLYLVHQNIGYMIIGIFDSYMVGVVVAIVISILIAFLIHHFIETPIVKIIKNKSVNKEKTYDQRI